MLLAQAANADVRSDAVRLLAHRVRQTGVDPKNVTISGVTVAANQALLSWDSGKQHGVMGLVLFADRWWDALDMIDNDGCWDSGLAYPLAPAHPYPDTYEPSSMLLPPDSGTLAGYGFSKAITTAASTQNADVRGADRLAAQSRKPGMVMKPYWCDAETYPLIPDAAIHPRGGTIHPPVRSFTSGYDVTIAYSPNDAKSDTKLTQLYARAPTHAEFAPNHPPAPGFGGPDAVCFFDLQFSGSKPVTFARGTTVDMWFPFVIDDQLRYNLSFFSAGKPSGMIFGTIFDNTLHFVLPQFTLVPDTPLMAEIDGDPKGPS
jgi:hypothetical protein